MTWARRTGQATLALLREAGVIVARGFPLLFGSAVVVVLVAWWIHRRDPALEEWVKLHQDPSLLGLANKLSYWGELHRAPLIALALIGAVGWRFRQTALLWAAGAGILAGCAAGIFANVIKIIVGRPRPSTPIPDGIHLFHTGWDYASFPSGHATHCFAISAAVSALAPRCGAALGLASLAVVWSRWYSMRHYISDIWAGAALGIAIGVVFGLAGRVAAKRELLPATTETKENAIR